MPFLPTFRSDREEEGKETTELCMEQDKAAPNHIARSTKSHNEACQMREALGGS